MKPTNAQAAAARQRSAAGSIDWEDLPSLNHLRVGAASASGASPVWEQTQPCGLEMLAPGVPLRQRVPGLEVREVNEPEVFDLFFTLPTPDQRARRV